MKSGFFSASGSSLLSHTPPHFAGAAQNAAIIVEYMSALIPSHSPSGALCQALLFLETPLLTPGISTAPLPPP